MPFSRFRRLHRAQHLLAANGVQHGGGLVQNKAIRLHGKHACNGHALLLAARKLVRRLVFIGVDACKLHGLVHPAAHLVRLYPQVFCGKGYILFHHGGHNLVIRVLEHHTHLLTQGQKVFFFRRMWACPLPARGRFRAAKWH